MKYFKTEKEEMVRLQEKDGMIYRMLGEVEVDKDMMEAFQMLTGKVTEEEREELLQLMKRYGLTPKAIESLIPYYKKDRFEKYGLSDKLQELIDETGRKDVTYLEYLDFVEHIKEVDQKEYRRQAEELESIREEYGDWLTDYLKGTILLDHIAPDTLKRFLPEASFLKKDEQQLLELLRTHHITTAFAFPVSYHLIVEMARDHTLSRYPEQLTYTVTTTGKTVDASFKKKDFIESVKQKQYIR